MCMAMLGLIGGVIQGIGAAAQASQQAANYQAQSQMEERQAVLEREAGRYKGDRQQDNVNRALGSQRAGYAASGLALTGTPGEVISETATEGAMDVAAIRWNSGLASENMMYKSKVSKMNADSASSSVGLAFLTPVIGSFAKFGGGFA